MHVAIAHLAPLALSGHLTGLKIAAGTAFLLGIIVGMIIRGKIG